jgi:hypothetical protein
MADGWPVCGGASLLLVSVLSSAKPGILWPAPALHGIDAKPRF